MRSRASPTAAQIPPLVRALYDELGGERFGDPFAVGPGSFAAWLREPVDACWPAVSRLWMELHMRRADLRAAYPDPLGADRFAFAHWTRETGARGARAARDARCARGTAGHQGGGDIVEPQPPAGSARVLAASLREHAAGGDASHVVADALEPGRERRARRAPDRARTPTSSAASAASPHELCVRLKPLALAALLDEGYSAALYLDADQWVLGDLEPLWDAVERSAIVLTPHLAGPAEGAGASARELMLLRAGTQNAGTVGVTDHPEARRMLAWWGERLDAANHGRVEEGAYYDQRWLDLVPGLFGGVEVLRDERFNVGHWSLPERDAADVRLLHASGFDPERPRTVTSHDPRLADVEAERVGALLERYAAELLAAGSREAARLPWGWARFEDGAPVPWMAGDVLSALGPDGDAFRADPLASGPGTFQAWLATAADDGRPAITRLWIGIHGRRGDLREAFPDPLGADRDAFAAWIAREGAREHGVAAPARRRRWRHRR